MRRAACARTARSQGLTTVLFIWGPLRSKAHDTPGCCTACMDGAGAEQAVRLRQFV